MAQVYQIPHSADILQRLDAVARTLRQRRRVRLAIRTAWVVLALWSVGLLAILLGIAIPTSRLLTVCGLALVGGLGYAWFSHPSFTRLARGLDRHYNLAQQLTTALEVAQHNPEQPLEERLLRETEALLIRMRRYFASRSLVPWREIETLVAMLLLAAGLTVAAQPLLPEAAAPIALPDMPPPAAPSEAAAVQPTEQPVNEEEQPQLSPEEQAAADAIADALRDNGATRSAADALDQGDTSGAASKLRELADQSDQLGDQARSDIAEGLRDAAEQLGDSQPGLADELRRQAEALEQGGQEAEQALEDLARTVEQLGEDGEQAAESEQSPSEQQGQQQGQQGQGDQQGAGQGAGNGNQLGGEQRGAQDGAQAQGDTLPLPQSSNASGPTTGATGPKGPTFELGAGGTGEAQSGGGNPGDQPLAGEADPLAIPPEYRDVVEDYFSPQP